MTTQRRGFGPLAGALVAGALVVTGWVAPAGSQTGSHGHDGHGSSRLLPLHAQMGPDAAVLDASGRTVVLRGVNVNSLGDYAQANPAYPTTVPVTGSDWDAMAAHGFNVVRLLVSWSRLEPEPGVIDPAYVREIRAAVRAAARRGMYSVVDMHQDAWGKFIASPPGVSCPPGTEPAIGWDGAPEWATITDGASTCRTGSREDSPAVVAAWDNFYADRDGIQTHLVNVWGHLARVFAHEPAVAGFDLINEPNHGSRPDVLDRLGDYYRRAIDAIRRGERARGGFSHMVFIETTVYGARVPPGFSSDTNLVFEGHNYGESLNGIPIEGTFDYFQAVAREYGMPLWIGEYGWFGDPPAQVAKLERYAAKEDQLLTAGDAWWQWRQACGDPHSVNVPNGTPAAVLVHFQRNGCPGDVNLGVVPEWQCTWRPYPRAMPGRVTVRVAGCAGGLLVAGTTARPGRADVWYPGAARPNVVGAVADSVTRRRVAGGWRVGFTVAGDYGVAIGA